MIPSLPRPVWLRATTVLYALAFFAFLFLVLFLIFLILGLTAAKKIAT